MFITKISPMTGDTNTINLPVTQEQLDRIEQGELIQNVLPYLSADEREFLISGLYPGEYDKMFPEEEEDEL